MKIEDDEPDYVAIHGAEQVEFAIEEAQRQGEPMTTPRVFTVCPDFLRPNSDQLEPGQYVLYSEYEELLRAWRSLNDQKFRCEERVTQLMNENAKVRKQIDDTKKALHALGFTTKP